MRIRLPDPPPALRHLLDEVIPQERLIQLVGTDDYRVPDEYRHWDKLTHLRPPYDLSLHEWWFLLRSARNRAFKPTPLEDRHGTPFRFGQPDIVLELLHKIDLRAGGSVGVADPLGTHDSKNQYLVRSLMEEAITSSQLEGAATTRRVAKELIRTGRDPRNEHERMIFNNYRTMLDIAELRETPLTPDLVMQIHATVTEGTLKDETAAGRFRRADERVVVDDMTGQELHVPPPADQLPERLDAMCAFANGQTPDGFVHPVLRSIILHFWLAYDHPFVDGNGRTARALFYWSALHYGLWLLEYVSISEVIRKAPRKYARAYLETESDNNDLTYFILYHLRVIHQAIDQLDAYVERKTKQVTELEAEIKALGKLNHRQRQLIGHALRNPFFEYQIESHRRSHAVVYQTARTDLLDLADRGLLQKGKVGREFRFTPAPDLEQRLRSM